MTWTTIAAFILASSLLIIAPGPDILFVVSKSMAAGARSGISVVAGLITGVLIYTSLAAAGLLLVVRNLPLVFNLVRWAGAAYLLYLAWSAWRHRHDALDLVSAQGANSGFWRLYGTGIGMSLLNPKLIIFFLAFFPQFVSLNHPHAGAHIMLLGFLFSLLSFVIFSLVAYGASHLTRHLREQPQTVTRLNITTALVLLGIALLLLFDNFVAISP